MPIQLSDFQKIGLGLSIFGVGFIFLGMIFLFDKGLLAVGNILFLAGLSMIIGFERTLRFFFQRNKIKATLLFFGGISIVLFGYPLVGMIFEIYGFFLLFGLVRFLNSCSRAAMAEWLRCLTHIHKIL
ncbi:unnamed protein product [Rotaria magnacalcarata]|uniref:Vesicle transport protein GOT1B n=1 Tax=Rotaria magnacalcarata TaxID=392030 RepID=A0A820UCY0_9BILA|nr:unnamed protein product [Rotaria magnacalcarata]